MHNGVFGSHANEGTANLPSPVLYCTSGPSESQRPAGADHPRAPGFIPSSASVRLRSRTRPRPRRFTGRKVSKVPYYLTVGIPSLRDGSITGRIL